MKVSQRRACAALAWTRSSVRYVRRTSDPEQRLVARLRELSRAHPRYGYRRITALLRQDGWRINRKRVQRLWRQEGLKVPRKQRKKRRWGGSANGAARRRAQRPNHVWSYDFIEDQTADGRKLKILPIVDEFTRECLTIEVERSFTAKDVVETLKFLFELRGAPDYLRSDNGPEFIAEAVKTWLAESGVNTLYIEPGSPWENPYSESFNSRFRDELLNRELFETLAEAKVLIEDHRLEYNHRRPHSALGYRTPAAYAATWATRSAGPREPAELLRPAQAVLS
jgi:putative transposase